MRLAVLAMLAVAVAAWTPALAEESTAGCVADMIGRAPAPVAQFIRRSQACLRFNGDEPMSPRQARSPRTPRAIRDLHCDRLQPDDHAMRRRFAHNAEAMRAMDQNDKELC
ncbi:MAG: hypothetical protein ACHP84_19645 [Caulobacterales bacterium]